MARTLAKYQQVVKWIQQNIEQGHLSPGDRLESENEIGNRFGVSRQTVRHALGILERDGVIESRQGSGNYIREKEILAKAQKSKTVVLISTYVNAYIFPNIIQGMESILEKAGWKIRIMFTHNEFGVERRILSRILEESDVDGLIMEPTMSGLPNPNLEYYREIQSRKIPIIFFHSYYEGMDIPHVSIDDKKAGYDAAKYLIEQGHKKIGGVFKLDDGQGHRRYSGYIQAMTEYKLKIKNSLVTWINTEEETDMSLSRDRLMRSLRECTACICYNDTVANNVVRICGEYGVDVPADLSIVSIDNSDLAKVGLLPLTSVIHPMEELGNKVAANFIKLAQDPSFDATYEFDRGLVIRNSVVACKSK